MGGTYPAVTINQSPWTLNEITAVARQTTELQQHLSARTLNEITAVAQQTTALQQHLSARTLTEITAVARQTTALQQHPSSRTLNEITAVARQTTAASVALDTKQELSSPTLTENVAGNDGSARLTSHWSQPTQPTSNETITINNKQSLGGTSGWNKHDHLWEPALQATTLCYKYSKTGWQKRQTDVGGHFTKQEDYQLPRVPDK